MEEEGCEFIIVYCTGEAEETDEADETEEALSPAEQMIRENTGIDLLIIPAEKTEDGTEETGPDRMTGRDGKTVYILYETEEMSACVFLFSEDGSGQLVHSISKAQK